MPAGCRLFNVKYFAPVSESGNHCRSKKATWDKFDRYIFCFLFFFHVLRSLSHSILQPFSNRFHDRARGQAVGSTIRPILLPVLCAPWSSRTLAWSYSKSHADGFSYPDCRFPQQPLGRRSSSTYQIPGGYRNQSQDCCHQQRTYRSHSIHGSRSHVHHGGIVCPERRFWPG